MLRRGLPATTLLLLCACGAEPSAPAPGRTGEAHLAIEAPLPEAFCTVVVDGIGEIDTEGDYLPHVITCENGGANLEALKAQAIAARSVVYYNMANQGSICDGQGCQVYSCGAEPSDVHYQAVTETSGMYLSYDGMLTYGFYVAGDNDTAPPDCIGVTGATEDYVTYNEGKIGGDVEQTSLGYIGPPGFGQNRGCMGQWGARCLENDRGYDYQKILRFYYGDDIGLLQAPGACVTPTPMGSPPTGNLDEPTCDRVEGWAQDPDEPTKAVEVEVSFEGPPGDSAAHSRTVTADEKRAELCDQLGSCEHGFSLGTPLSLHDGDPHEVHAYAIDSESGESAVLDGVPAELRCTPRAPEGIRRKLKDTSTFEAWRFSDYWDVLTLDQATIDEIEEGPELPDAPELAKSDDGAPEVWLIDGDFRRHVPNPSVFAAWSFDWDAIEEMPADELDALSEGTAVRSRPTLVTTTSGDVFYLIDDDQSASVSGHVDASCSCRTAGGTRPSTPWLLLLAASPTLGFARRRSRSAPRPRTRLPS